MSIFVNVILDNLFILEFFCQKSFFIIWDKIVSIIDKFFQIDKENLSKIICFCIFVIILLIVILVKILFYFNKGYFIGKKGEIETINIVVSINWKFKVLYNLIIPTKNGGTNEIDTICITDKCIFVIETKNISGKIYGNDTDNNWIQITNQRFEKYNPILQNATHIKYIKKLIPYNVPCFSIIVLSDRCEIVKMNISDDKVIVLKMSKLKNRIKHIYKKQKKVLNTSEINEIYKILLKYKKADKKTKKEHLDYIKEKY